MKWLISKVTQNIKLLEIQSEKKNFNKLRSIVIADIELVEIRSNKSYQDI